MIRSDPILFFSLSLSQIKGNMGGKCDDDDDDNACVDYKPAVTLKDDRQSSEKSGGEKREID